MDAKGSAVASRVQYNLETKKKIQLYPEGETKEVRPHIGRVMRKVKLHTRAAWSKLRDRFRDLTCVNPVRRPLHRCVLPRCSEQECFKLQNHISTSTSPILTALQ